ncbi:TonB-dependent receptor [Chitinophaga sp. MM2321]|uniref:TonB-dependent receptor n=1 Tax=Chitinophaga sp. MM2321 TaxID=3137178 RepID=UPI0032D58EA7
MKLTFLLLTVACLQVSATAFSQQITMKLEQASLKKVFAEIKRQTGYDVLFSTELLEKASPVTIHVKDASIQEVLATVLNKQPLTYRIENRLILIGSKPIPAASEPALVKLPVKGKVTDSKGLPVPGVSILEKGTSNGTITNDQGEFSLNVQSDASILIIRSIGYVQQEIKAGSQEIKVVLQEDLSAMSEVVVVGYGSQRKANLTGAVSSVKMDEVLGDRPVSSASQALQGAVPGLQVTFGSGQPGTSTALNIRGFTSINGGAPLVLVDNVPMDIDDVNPKDIDNVTVLKDAAAASIYGARAAFGVILITTKKGKKNQPIKFNYSTNLTSSTPISLPQKATPIELVSALKDFGTTSYWTGQNVDTWLGLLKEYNQDHSKYPNGSTTVNGLMYPLAETDLYGDLFTRGFEQLHNFSFGGGSEKTTFRVSGGYTGEDGILVTNKDKYTRYNLNTYVSTELTKNLNASVNLFYKNSNRTTPANYSGLFYNAITYSSYMPTGFGTAPNGDVLPYNTPNNVVKTEPINTTFGDDLRLFGKLEYNPLNGFKVTAEYTFNKSNSDDRKIQDKNEYINAATYDRQFLNNNTRYTRANNQTTYQALNVYANYTKELGNHHLNFLVGTNQELSKQESFTINRLDMLSSQVPSLSTSTGTIDGDDSFGEYAISGYFGRINYDYKNKYLLEVNGRFDGSSRFPATQRFGFFPSVSAGWNVSEESFMKPLADVIPQFKLRGSFGEIGNQVVNNTDGTPNYYPYVPGLATYNAAWTDPATNLKYLSLHMPALVSSSFTWETVRTLNFGTDISLLRGRLNTSFDWFQRSTLNMLAPGADLPAILGAAAPLQNVADLQSKGWEWEMSWKDKIKEVSYSIGFNLSDSRAYITRYNNPAGLLTINASGQLDNYYVGEEIGEIWGYVTKGYFTIDDFEKGTLNANLQKGTLLSGVAGSKGVQQNPGDVRYEDLNGDGVIFTGNNTLANSGDRKVIGNARRRFQFGVFGNASYKNFDFSFFLQGVGKRDMWLSDQLYWPYLNQFGTLYKHNLNYWTPENPDGFYPRSYPDAAGNTTSSRNVQTKYMSDGAYLRVKNITLGYAVPKHLLKRIFIDNIRVFVSGENLFTFDHLPAGMDPEADIVSDGGIYPFMKKYSFGVNVNF